MRTCGECKWFVPAMPDSVVYCAYTVPMWARGWTQISRYSNADTCPCFAQREETDHETE